MKKAADLQTSLKLIQWDILHIFLDPSVRSLLKKCKTSIWIEKAFFVSRKNFCFAKEENVNGTSILGFNISAKSINWTKEEYFQKRALLFSYSWKPKFWSNIEDTDENHLHMCCHVKLTTNFSTTKIQRHTKQILCLFSLSFLYVCIYIHMYVKVFLKFEKNGCKMSYRATSIWKDKY